MRLALSALALILASPVAASAAEQPVTVGMPAADRVAAAMSLMDTLYPPATRDSLFDSIFNSLMASVKGSMQPMMAKMDFPDAQAIMDKFMQRTMDRTKTSLVTSMPGMFQAFSEAYARKFTVAELQEIKAFAATPVGQRYISESMRLMEDPSVSAWQTAMMRDQMGQVERDVEELTAEIIKASEAAEKRKGDGAAY